MPTGPDHLDTTARRIGLYETHVRDLARARIGTDLARIQAQFRAAVEHAQAMRDPALLLAARRQAASDLRALRPAVAPLLRAAVADGVTLGAELAGGTVPKGIRPMSDPAIKVVLQRVNTPIRRHARLSADAVLRLPVNTAAQLERVIDRIGAVITEVDAAAGVITTRAVDVGTEAVTTAQGVPRIWVTRTGCCPVCASYSGSTAPPGGGFLPRARYGDRDGQWEHHDGIQGPPLHASCLCHTVRWQPRLADRLARQAEADVAAGRIAASMPARIRAVERMLAGDARLTQRTRERAQRSAARGRFTGQRPANPRRSQSA